MTQAKHAMPDTLTAKSAQTYLRGCADAAIAKHSQGFFKTGQGEYGQGDKFLGIRVPVVRAAAKRYAGLSVAEVTTVLKSAWHEERQFALLVMVNRYAQADSKEQARLYKLYLANTGYINNWDLVDCSAHKIVGPYLTDKSRKPLYQLARSKDLWEKRIAIMSTFHFIKNADFDDTLAIAKILLTDEHDLIHKAVGWMLREIGKLNQRAEESFLHAHYKQMPRTMLRYAIERFPEKQRQAYLKGSV